MSDIFWQAFFGAIVSIILGWMQYRTKRSVDKAAKKADEHADRTADRVEKMQDSVTRKDEKVEAKLQSLEKVGKETHSLVNGALGVQLKITSILARRLAEMPGATAEDQEAARVAEEKYAEHEKTFQAMVAKEQKT
jgi:hypothetical protein